MSDNSIPPNSFDPQPMQPPPPAPPAPPAPQYAPAAPQQGYPAPQQGYPVQQPGYPSPQQGYPAAQQPYGAVAPMQPVYAYSPPRPNSGLAITSLICGLAGLVLFWLFAPVIASIVAVITGHMALKQIKANPMLAGRGLAITGLITGYVGLGLLVIEILLFVGSLVLFGAFTIPFISSQV